MDEMYITPLSRGIGGDSDEIEVVPRTPRPVPPKVMSPRRNRRLSLDLGQRMVQARSSLLLLPHPKHLTNESPRHSLHLDERRHTENPADRAVNELVRSGTIFYYIIVPRCGTRLFYFAIYTTV